MNFKLKKIVTEDYINLIKIGLNHFKVCDITGLPTKYTDPRSQLNFYDTSVYNFIKSLDYAEVERYYEISHYKRL